MLTQVWPRMAEGKERSIALVGECSTTEPERRLIVSSHPYSLDS